MKRITSFAVSLSMLVSVVAPVAAGAQSMGSNFNYNLTIGSKGDSVVALQSFLVAKGLLTMPAGVPMGYFGGLTKSAVAAYQISKGIQPSAGYFGPITRAAVNADMMSMGGTTTTTAGCSAGAMYNSMTGASCSTVVTSSNCPSGALFNAQTGASCTTTTTTTTTSGVEGSLDIRLGSNPADNSNIKTQTDVSVYGLEIRSRIADVAVQTLDLQVGVVNGSSSENPATLISTIKVWDGSNVIATIPVNLTSFTKDQNQVYYIRIAGLNFLVPKDATKNLTVSFSTASIDNDRTVTIDGYQSSSVRAVSGNGVSSFYSIDGSGYTRTHTFKKPGTSTLTLSNPATTLRSQNYRVNGNDVVSNVVLGSFSLKSESGASTLLTVNASTTASGTLPTTLYLYNGSTLLKSKTVPSSGSVAFDNLDTTTGATVAQSDTPTTFTIKADFPANTANGTFASTTINSVIFQTPAGNSATASGSAVSNANQYIYSKAAIITLKSAPTIAVSSQTVAGVGTTTLVATFALNIRASGGNVLLPNVSGREFNVVFSNGTNYTATSTSLGASISVATIPNNDIADGSDAAVTVTASCNGSCALTNGLYNAALTSIVWNAGNGSTTQTYGLDDFKTSSAVQFTR